MSDKDYDDETPLSAAEFRMPIVAANNKGLFDKYIELRLKGKPPIQCMRMVFGDEYTSDNQGYARVFGLESSSYFMREFPKRLEETPFAQLWNPKESVFLLLQIANDPGAKDQARLNAIDKLNILSGITMVDGTGNTRVTRGLDDFYKDIAKDPGTFPEPPAAPELPTKH